MTTTVIPTAVPPAAHKPLAELRSWLSESADRCRAQRWLGALFRFSVAQDIVADEAKRQDALSREAFAARVATDEALALLDAAASKEPKVRRAAAILKRSRERLHNLAESLAGNTCAMIVAVGLGAAVSACIAGNNELRTVRAPRCARRRDDVEAVA